MRVESVVQPYPSDWKLVELGSICAAGGGYVQTGPFGSQLHAADYVPVGIPSVMPANIGDNNIVEDGIARITEEDAKRLSKYLLRKGDIVYSRRGDVERRALVRENEDGWLCGTGCLRVRFGNESIVNSVYASYYLGHPEVRSWIVRHAIGATMPNLNTSIMSSLPFLVPPLSEQRAIAHILGTLDDKIELNRKMNQTLEEMARTIFKSWFVDFNPVRAKAEGKKPAGMDDATAALFPDGFEDSELGEIPRGWENITLGDRVTFLGGYSFKSKDWTAAGVPVVKIGSVKPGIIDLTQVSYVSPKIAEGASRYRLDTGDLLIGMTGYVGEVGLVPPTKESPLLNQRVGKLVFEDGIQELPFWYCVTRPEISDLFDRGS